MYKLKKKSVKKAHKTASLCFFYLVIQVYDPDKISSIRILKIQTLKRLIYFYLLASIHFGHHQQS